MSSRMFHTGDSKRQQNSIKYVHSTFYSAPKRKCNGKLVTVLKHHGMNAYQEGEDKAPCILNV